jgi:D-glycerate 3-kinase
MWVNKALTRYQQLFGLLDCLVMLKAPDFKCVASWRLEQEERLDSSLTDDADRSAIMDKSQIERFVQHYQRLTEHALATLENNADVVFNLNASRKIVSSTLKAKTGGL